MCYNCGCDLPEDNMGKPDMTGASLTKKSFDEMAKKWNMPTEEAQKNVYKLLRKQFEGK